MNSEEAFDQWADDYALDAEPLSFTGRRMDCQAAWDAALTWAANQQEPFGWVDEAGKFIRRTEEGGAVTCKVKLTALYKGQSND